MRYGSDHRSAVRATVEAVVRTLLGTREPTTEQQLKVENALIGLRRNAIHEAADTASEAAHAMGGKRTTPRDNIAADASALGEHERPTPLESPRAMREVNPTAPTEPGTTRRRKSLL